MTRPLAKDVLLSKTKALPSGASTVSSDGIDLGQSRQGDFGSHLGELLIEAPALAVGQLADDSTMKYEVYHDTDSDFGSEVSLYGTPQLTQTGAGGVGAAATSKRVALPSDVKRYIRVKATNSAATDASDSEYTASLVF